jgi:hypothetical protein
VIVTVFPTCGQLRYDYQSEKFLQTDGVQEWWGDRPNAILGEWFQECRRMTIELGRIEEESCPFRMWEFLPQVCNDRKCISKYRHSGPSKLRRGFRRERSSGKSSALWLLTSNLCSSPRRCGARASSETERRQVVGEKETWGCEVGIIPRDRK